MVTVHLGLSFYTLFIFRVFGAFIGKNVVFGRSPSEFFHHFFLFLIRNLGKFTFQFCTVVFDSSQPKGLVARLWEFVSKRDIDYWLILGRN